MTKTEITVTISSRRDWIKRFMKKNSKYEMASALADVRELYESTTDPEVEERLEQILHKVLW